jgi:hypothetical protein
MAEYILAQRTKEPHMRLAKKIVVTLLVLVIVIAGGAWLMIDTLAKAGIQKGGAYATGVPTDVQSVNLSLLHGSMAMESLQVSNPSGFTSPHLMQTGHFSLQIISSSVLGSPVEVVTFELDGLDVCIDQKGATNNISVVLDHIKQLSGSGEEGSPGQTKSDGGGKKIKVARIVIKNVIAHVQVPLSNQLLEIKLPELELNDVASDQNGATIGQVIARIIPALIAAIVEKGKGILPRDLTDTLNHDIAGAASSLGPRASNLVKNLSPEAGNLIGFGDNTTKDPGKNAGDDLKNLFKPKHK